MKLYSSVYLILPFVISACLFAYIKSRTQGCISIIEGMFMFFLWFILLATFCISLVGALRKRKQITKKIMLGLITLVVSLFFEENIKGKIWMRATLAGAYNNSTYLEIRKKRKVYSYFNRYYVLLFCCR
jgi:hypothetical protein